MIRNQRNPAKNRLTIPGQIQVDRLRRLLGDIKVKIRQLPYWIKLVVLLWLLSRAVTFSAVLAEWLLPKLSEQHIDWFVCPGYHNPMPMKWWVKFVSDPLAWVINSYAICILCKQVSDFLFLCSVLFLSYQVLDLLMFVWNFERYSALYVDMLYTVVALIFGILRIYPKKLEGKIRSLF